MSKLIVVQGPTASGKTDLAIQLALALKTEIISADSRQFYKELSIGTAKPSHSELAQVKHHLVDCSSINEEISAARFAKLAEPILNELLDNNGFAVLVGGSGMFVDALIHGLDEIPVNSEIRNQLSLIYSQSGLEPLLKELEELDPNYLKQIDQKNPMRIIRALEAIRESGRKLSDLHKNSRKKRDFGVLRFVINWPRDILYNRINKRVDYMIELGLINEVVSLKNFRNLNALNTVGYKEIFDFLDDEYSKDRAIELIKQHTRNYAKRQLTWLRRYDHLYCLNPLDEKSVFEQAIANIKAI
jgi:tRNA dimethylallyltransferase